jgi:small subunit ribosomal protein S9
VAESTETRDAVAEPEAEQDEAGEHVSEYTTQTGEAPARPAARKPVVTGTALGTGRRKEAIARVRIMPGTGQWKINDRTLDDYFPNKVHQQLISEPFVTLGAEDQFDVVARIDGGGVTGQAGALRLGIARALTLVDPDSRPSLKRAGFLTRDARVKERKKAGLKKARKAPQYSKR